jgi:DNA-binding MarR family transcriptional regulator
VVTDGRTMGELAAALGVQAPTVTKMVSRLASAGLLERRQDGGDGRQARVYLTLKGRDRTEGIDRIWKALDRQTFAGFDPKDRKRLKKLLRRMRDNLETGEDELAIAPSATGPKSAALPDVPLLEPLQPAASLTSEEA